MLVTQALAYCVLPQGIAYAHDESLCPWEDCERPEDAVAVCGNGCVDIGEACDDSSHLESGPNEARCSDTCVIASCTDTVSCAILPEADTRIEVGEEEREAHGHEDTIEADAEKRAMAYLKFNLRGISTRITKATLRLWCTDSSPDGGTVYPVPDSSWIEGTEKDGPGLKWIDVDADNDGAIGATERSRFAPDFTRPIATLPPCTPPPGIVDEDEEEWATPAEVNVTKAFQDGADVYTLAITNDNPNSVKYASREACRPEWRPVLMLEFAYVCGNFIQDPGEECDDGNAIDGDGCDSNCTFTGCGNGIVTRGEACDDGTSCTSPCCGDGHVDPGESCDEGGASAACDSDCTPRVCGDGTRNADAGEGCDDGNTTDGDGCSAECTADCCTAQNFPGCDAGVCERCVCTVDPFCCSPSGLWDDRCVLQAGTACAGACLCGACQGDECLVHAAADTYIAGPDLADECFVNDCATCGETTWDHGGRTALQVNDDTERGIAYLKFDLSKLPRPVIEANLRLVVTPDREPKTFPAGGTIYALDDSSWIEGSCDGDSGNCACDPGDGTCACDAGDGRCFAACAACVGAVVCEVDGNLRRDDDPVSCEPIGQCVEPEDIATCPQKPQATSCDALRCQIDDASTICQPDLEYRGDPTDDTPQEAIDECIEDGDDEQTCTLEGLEEILECEVCEDLMPCANPEIVPCSQKRALTFTDVDTNGNGTIDEADESPFLPDFSKPLASIGEVTSGEAQTVAVTDALQSGPGVYSFVVSQIESDKAVEYRSRENLSSEVPLLALTLGCNTDDECDTEASCLPRRCIEGQCVAQPKGGCKVCNQRSDCEDHNPCTNEFCDTVNKENGCQFHPAPQGIQSVTCALEPFSNAACQLKADTTRGGARKKLDSKFECTLNKRLAKLCTRLVQPCMKASRVGRDPSRRNVKKLIRRARATLRKLRRSVLLKAADLSTGKPITKRCARMLDERIDLAGQQLDALTEDARDPNIQRESLLACSTIDQGICTPRSEVCD